MDLSYSPEDLAFQHKLRAFLDDDLPVDIAENVRLGRDLTKGDMERWHAILNARGWLAQNWPKAFGGAEWSAVQRHIYDVEAAARNAPRIVPFGVSMLGPVLQKFGSKEQQDHWLPRILDGSDWWCQGYSEPGAGSDLASLKCRAERDGDHFIVNGQKTWTTLGQHANMIFCLVRTDAYVKQQEGISFLLIDMDTPGVKVRPIILLEGCHEVNEVWFTDVKVPVANLVGEENKGWTYAKYLLTHERTGLGGVGANQAALAAVKRLARAESHNGKPLLQNPHFAARVAQVEIDMLAMATSNLRIVSQAATGGAPGLEASMLKVKGSILRQEINDLARRAAGPYAMPFASEAIEGANDMIPDPNQAGPVAAQYFNNRKLSIFGGSNEIQRGIISKTTMSGGA